MWLRFILEPLNNIDPFNFPLKKINMSQPSVLYRPTQNYACLFPTFPWTDQIRGKHN